jgi:hypothetical protein
LLTSFIVRGTPLSKVKISRINKRLACRLPIICQVVERLYNPDSSILHCLAMPNTVLSRTVFSDEKVVFQDDRTIISTNDYFTRYIRIASDELRPTGKKFRNFKGIKNFLSAFWYSNSIMKTDM